MSQQLLTPVDHKASTVVDLATKRYRKQLLKDCVINYEGRQIVFDRKFMTDLSNSFKDNAFDAVPLQLADAKNTHTDDVERTGGHLVDVELTADGLDGIFELNPRGVAVLQDHNNKVGVSASIVQQLSRADGKNYPVAIKHVLATADPRLNGLRPWQDVNLANDPAITETIDLSAEAYPGETEGKMSDTKTKAEGLVSLQLTAEQAKGLLELATENEELKKLDLKAEDFEEVPEEDGTKGDDEKVTPPAKADPVEDKTTALGLTADATAAIELARSTAEAAKTEVLNLTAQLRKANIDGEIKSFQDRGLSPIILDLARPLLEAAPTTIDLANGETKDPGALVRNLLDEVINLSRDGLAVIELGVTSGVFAGSAETHEAQLTGQLEALRNQFDD